MSRLQHLMKALINTIVSYNESQSESTQSHSIELLIKEPHEELIKNLQKLIKEATSKYVTRAPVLNYFLYVVNKLKPLIDQPTPLSVTDYQTVQDTLVTLITNMQTLMKTSHSTQEVIEYDDKKEPMYGFIRSFLRQYSLSNSAQIIEKQLFTNFELRQDTPAEQVISLIKEIVDEHQVEQQPSENPLAGENKLLKEDNSRLQEDNSTQKLKFTKLEEDYVELEKKLLESQEKEKTLEGQLKLLQAQFDKNTAELERQREENSTLKSAPSTTQPAPLYGPLFRGLSPLLRV